MGVWTPDGETVVVGAGGTSLTLVEGTTFCVCNADGGIDGSSGQGLFVRDTRIVSHWRLLIDDRPPEHLDTIPGDPYAATFVGHLPPSGARPRLVVRRDRYVGDGMREDVTLTNLGTDAGREAVPCRLTVEVGADLADLFDVRRGRPAGVEVDVQVLEDRLRLVDGNAARGVEVSIGGGRTVEVSPDRLVVVVDVPARSNVGVSIMVRAVVDSATLPAAYPVDRPVEQSPPVRRFAQWQAAAPVVTGGGLGLERTLARTTEDIGALRIFDPDDPDSAGVAAGAPWYMALFGRDSLLTSYLGLMLDQSLALGTLRMLARRQGERVDDDTEEQPGRVLHEARLGGGAARLLGGAGTYFGTADATPLFVVLLAELHRWGVDPQLLAPLLPHADRALAWVEEYGDRDGDGFVEYQRTSPHGLVNQGWKDSPDSVNFADGRIAAGPIALCEVQGYVHAAYVGRAELAGMHGDVDGQRDWSQRAAALKSAFNERYWLPDRGWFAVALDGDKQPVDALTSNIGHCLWSGIVDDDKAPALAEHLSSPEMFTGWGIRTLATSMAAYDPVSYHNGSVWPHDTAIAVAGLVRYGFVNEATAVATAVLEAADAFDGRLPELFCGFDRSAYARPVPYPTSCSPQAWAAATPVSLMRSLLGFDPDVPGGLIGLDAVLPSSWTGLQVDGVRLAGRRLRLTVGPGRIDVDGLPDGVRMSSARRG